MANFARSVRRRDMGAFNEARIKKIMEHNSNIDLLTSEGKEKARLELVRLGLKRRRGDYTPLPKKRKKR